MGKKVVRVRIGEGCKLYHFYTDISDLQAGDKVVLHVGVGNGLALGEVVSEVNGSHRASKWIIQKVDFAEHLARVEAEKRTMEILNELHRRSNKIEQRHRYEILAASDSKMSALLKELRELEGQFL